MERRNDPTQRSAFPTVRPVVHHRLGPGNHPGIPEWVGTPLLCGLRSAEGRGGSPSSSRLFRGLSPDGQTAWCGHCAGQRHLAGQFGLGPATRLLRTGTGATQPPGHRLAAPAATRRGLGAAHPGRARQCLQQEPCRIGRVKNPGCREPTRTGRSVEATANHAAETECAWRLLRYRLPAYGGHSLRLRCAISRDRHAAHRGACPFPFRGTRPMPGSRV